MDAFGELAREKNALYDPSVMQDNRATVEAGRFGTDMEVDLGQYFLIPANAGHLSFTITILTTDGLFLPGFTPDAFGVALLDPSGWTPLTATVDAVTGGQDALGETSVVLGRTSSGRATTGMS